MSSIRIDNDEEFVVRGLKSVAQREFCSSWSLKSINLPETIETIGEAAFSRCYYLKRINSDVDGVVIFPSRIRAISDSCFSDCRSIATVKLPEDLSYIGSWAFSGCFCLASISFPSKLETIGAMAFSGCSSLKEINIPASVKTIGEAAFYGCKNIETINVNPSNEHYFAIDNVLYNTRQELLKCAEKNPVKNIVIPEGITKIKSSAFVGCKTIETVVLPKSLKTIGAKAFYGCKSLSSVIFSDGLKNIGEDAFCHCPSLKKIILPAGLKENYSACYQAVDFTQIEFKEE